MSRLKSRVAVIVRSLGYEIHRIPSTIDDTPRTTAKLPVPEGIRGVNYGCGSNLVSEWLNVDLAAPAGGVGKGLHFRAVDVTNEHPFPDESFELGYAEDFLEHIPQADSLVFLSEAYRTLRRGGLLRLSFPGLEGVLRKHYLGSSIPDLAEAQRGAYDMWEHVHFYSRSELRLVASHIGFQGIEFMSFGKSQRPELAHMDTRRDQADVNTFAELTKGPL